MLLFVCFPWAAVCDQISSSAYHCEIGLEVIRKVRRNCSKPALLSNQNSTSAVQKCVRMFSWRTISDLFVQVFLCFGKMPAWQAGRTKGQYWKYLVWDSLIVTTQQVWNASKLDRQLCPVLFMVSLECMTCLKMRMIHFGL